MPIAARLLPKDKSLDHFVAYRCPVLLFHVPVASKLLPMEACVSRCPHTGASRCLPSHFWRKSFPAQVEIESERSFPVDSVVSYCIALLPFQGGARTIWDTLPIITSWHIYGHQVKVASSLKNYHCENRERGQK